MWPATKSVFGDRPQKALCLRPARRRISWVQEISGEVPSVIVAGLEQGMPRYEILIWRAIDFYFKCQKQSYRGNPGPPTRKNHIVVLAAGRARGMPRYDFWAKI